MSTADAINLPRRAYERARRAEEVAELLEFLGHYLRLRRDVLTGRHHTTSPLGIRFRWRLRQYGRHQRRVQERDWRQ